MGGMGRRIVVFAVALSALFPAPVHGQGGVPVLVIDGRGFGHGVGMAQDGAFWMGRDGAQTNQILGQFYPGTRIGKGAGNVRVVVLAPQPSNDTVVGFPGGGEIRDALSGPQSAGFPVRVPAGGQVRLHWDGSRYSVVTGGAGQAQAAPSAHLTSFTTPNTGAAAEQLPTDSTTTSSTLLPPPTEPTTTTTAPPAPTPPPQSTTTTAPPPSPPASAGPSSSRTLWAVPVSGAVTTVPARGRQYRGAIEATAAPGSLELVNELDVEQYLRGMGEVRDPSWPAASLRTQAIAARTYAMRAMGAAGQICDDTRCQVYLGQQAEYGAMDKAVSDTRGQVLFYGSSLASTVYSANGGGIEGTRQEGFGTSPDDSSYPYLRSAPYPTKDPMPWTVKVALTDVAARLGYSGHLASVRVAATGPSGRVLSVQLDGDAGGKQTTGIAAAAALGLKSTLFTLRSETDSAAPAPPPTDASFIQLLPEDAAASAPALPSGPVVAGPLSIPDLPPGTGTPGHAAAVAPTRSGGIVQGTLLGLLLVLLVGGGTSALVVARRAGLSGRSLLPF